LITLRCLKSESIVDIQQFLVLAKLQFIVNTLEIQRVEVVQALSISLAVI
jgi:hypothetical protein